MARRLAAPLCCWLLALAAAAAVARGKATIKGLPDLQGDRDLIGWSEQIQQDDKPRRGMKVRHDFARRVLQWSRRCCSRG